MDQQKVVGAILCLLVGTIAWSSYRIEHRTEKLEGAVRIIMVESEECTEKCPGYKTGEYSNGSFKAPDNTDHEKCSSKCSGEQRQKLRALMSQ